MITVACAHEAVKPSPSPTPTPNPNPPALPFRAWLVPPPYGPVKPATAEAKCVDGAATGAHERQRHRAALDEELRKHNALLLRVRELRGVDEGAPLGSIVRGPEGERWMIAGTTDDCGNALLEVGLDASGNVFTVVGEAHAAQKRQLRLCSAWCGGVCGHAQPRRPLVVEVPPNAHLSATRTVSYALDVEVEILPVSADGYRFDCNVP